MRTKNPCGWRWGWTRAGLAGAAVVGVLGFGGVAQGAATHEKKLLAPDLAMRDSFGSAVALEGDTCVVGSHQDNHSGVDRGTVYVYQRHEGGANNWGFVKQIVAPDGAAGDEFGVSVSISGDTILVGAHLDDDSGEDSGSAYVFGRDVGGANNWGLVKKIVAPDGAAEDSFGGRSSVSGDIAVVGARNDDDLGSLGGAAYVFGRDVGGADNWGFVKKLLAPDGAASDRFGSSVGVSGDSALVGANGDDDAASESGSAYVFERGEGGADNWGFVKKLVAPDAALEDLFGNSASIDGDVIVIGANEDDDTANGSGSAYVFGRDEGGADNWGFVKKLVAPDASIGDAFGRSVSVDGDRVAIGADFADGATATCGAVYLFERDAGGADNWGFVSKCSAPDGEAGDTFGRSVALHGSRVVGGAPGDDDAGLDTGSAHVFAIGACFGDLNGDDMVDTADLGLLIGAFGTSGPSGDLNGDNVVDTADLGLLLGVFGTACAP